MELDNCILFKDRKIIEEGIKKKYYAPYQLYYDAALLKMVFEKLGIDSSSLNDEPPYNDYKNNLMYKKEFASYCDYCDFMDKNFELYLKTARTFSDILKKNEFIYMENFNCSRSYTMNEMIKILLDFYASLGENEYNFALKYIKEKRIFLIQKDLDEPEVDGKCFTTKYLGGSYIFVISAGKIDLKTMMNIAHELGHAYEREMVNHKFNKYNAFETKHIVEVSSIFYQSEFLRYLEKNNINYFETVNLINSFYNWASSFNEDLLSIADEDLIVEEDSLYTLTDKDNWFIGNDYEFIKLFNKCDENLNITGEVFPFSADVDDDILYGNGTYIALHLQELKKQDPKEFKRVFNNFLTMRTLMSYDDILEMLGINKEDFLSGKLIESQVKKDNEAFKRIYKMNT